MNDLTHLSLFTGIGGIDLATEWAGFRTVGQVEQNPYALRVLRRRFGRRIPRWTDIHDLSAEDFIRRTGIDSPTLISGGFPCQPFSCAGKRRGKADDRYLWPEMFRIVRELRPAWVLGENVAGIVNMELESCCADLEGEDYTVRSFLIPACGVGAPHQRTRIFIVAYTNDRGSDKADPVTLSVRGDVGSWGDVGGCGGRQSFRKSHEDVAYSSRFRCKSNGKVAARKRVGSKEEGSHTVKSGQDVAHSESGGAGRIPTRSRDQRKGENDSHGCGETLANTCSQGLQESAWSGFRGIQKEIGSSTWGELGRGTTAAGCYWSVEPAMGRVATGIPHRVDRLRCLGNAVVPQQVYPILAGIAQIEEDRNR